MKFTSRTFLISEMYSSKLISSLFFCLVVLLCYCSSNEDIYKEELYIRPLSTGHTYYNLLFTTVVSPEILEANIGKFFD